MRSAEDYIYALVRRRSPVQIWLAAHKQVHFFELAFFIVQNDEIYKKQNI